MNELQLAILQASFETNSKAPNLAKALAEVQGEIRGIKKNKVSQATGASVSYLDGNKLYENLLPALSNRNVLVSTSVYPISNEPRNVTTKNAEVKTKFLFKGILHFQFILDSEVIQGVYPVEGDQFDDTSKSMGTAITYSDRYFLMKYFKIETDKDDADAKDAEGKAVAPKQQATPVVATAPAEVKKTVAKTKPASEKEVAIVTAVAVKPSIKEETKPAEVTPLPKIVYTQPAPAEVKPVETQHAVPTLTAEQAQTKLKAYIVSHPDKNTEVVSTIKAEMVKFGKRMANELSVDETLNIITTLTEMYGA